MDIQDIEKVIRQELRNRDEDCAELESENRRKVDELLFIVKGNPDAGIRGMAEILRCLADFKPELRFLKKLKKTVIYILIASIIAWISILIKLFYER